MSTTSEKQATGFEMTSYVHCVDGGTSCTAICYQNRRIVFVAKGCESRQHAEQIARDIIVRYALVERPTI